MMWKKLRKDWSKMWQENSQNRLVYNLKWFEYNIKAVKLNNAEICIE